MADLLAIVNRLDSTWQLVHHRVFDEVLACARAGCDSATAYLVVCRFDPSTNCLIALQAYAGRAQAAGNRGERLTEYNG